MIYYDKPEAQWPNLCGPLNSIGGGDELRTHDPREVIGLGHR